MRKLRALCLALILFTPFLNQQVAHAAWITNQISPLDVTNNAGLPSAYDLTQISFGVSDANPNNYEFFLYFAQPVTYNLFADGLGSWAAVLLDVDGDGKVDYSLETTSNIYENNTIHPGKFVNRVIATPVTSSICEVETWSNIPAKVNWIGFTIPKVCLPVPDKITVQGYSEHGTGTTSQFDYAPDQPWQISMSGAAVASPAPTPTLTPQASLLNQSINVIFTPKGIWTGMKDIFLLAESSSGLPLSWQSSTQTVCRPNLSDSAHFDLILVAPGICSISFMQAGSVKYAAAETKILSFAVSGQPTSPTAKKVTIVCKKGSLIKKVIALKPVCPKGYQKSK